MKNQVCLDAGVIFQYFSKPRPEKVSNLMNDIEQEKVIANVLKPVLCEVFFHLCKAYGKESAEIQLMTFTRSFPVQGIDLDDSLVLKAGLLKCQHRKQLSYNDCMSIAWCLNNKVEFHTTEKLLKRIPENTCLPSEMKVFLNASLSRHYSEFTKKGRGN